MKASALWHIDKKTTAILEEEISPSGEKSVLIKTDYSCISTGTETLVANGLVPNQIKENMKVNYMGGSFDFPIKYGYSLVGKTEDGRNVHLMHPHQNFLYAKESDLFTIPQELSNRKATLLSNMETAVNAVWDAQLTGKEKVLIIGFGGIGALLALTIKHYCGINPSVLELDKDKVKKAKNMGFSIRTEIFDVIFHTSASNTGLQYALDHVKKDGSVIELSWYGNKMVNLKLGANFHYNRVKLISSQVSTVSPFAPCKGYGERKQIACKLLLHESYDELISNEIPFEDMPTHFDALKTKGNNHALVELINYTKS
jgi:threonine dehydrogenase-like Zn-dependent dehydrogenase